MAGGLLHLDIQAKQVMFCMSGLEPEIETGLPMYTEAMICSNSKLSLELVLDPNTMMAHVRILVIEIRRNPQCLRILCAC